MLKIGFIFLINVIFPSIWRQARVLCQACVQLTFLTANYTTFVLSWLYLYLSLLVIYHHGSHLLLHLIGQSLIHVQFTLVIWSVCVRVCIQCITVPTETLLQKLNHDTMFTHNAVRHSCTVWCQCICPQCSSVLVLMNLISDQPTLLHDTTVYFDMFFIACTVFSLFLYSFNHINSCVWSMLSTTTGVSDSN